MNEIRFSIIIPVYNVSAYLEQCIESVLIQSYQNFQLILIDDGSTDNSGKICDDFALKDNRILVIHQKNGGPSSARKTGAANLKGEYVVCIDGDDYVDVDYLSYFDKLIARYNSDIVTCGYFMVFPNKIVEMNSQFVGLYNKERIKHELYPMLLSNRDGKSINPNIWAKAIKRDLYLNIQMVVPNSLYVGEDAAVTRPCFYRANTIYFGEEKHYYYRQNSNSITNVNKSVTWETPKCIMDHFETQFDFTEYDFIDQKERYLVHFIFDVIISQFYQRKDYFEVKKIIMENIEKYNYQEAISRADYSVKSKEFWVCMLMKYHIFLPLKFYSLIR